MEISETICQEQMELIIQEKHMGTSWHRGNLGFSDKSAIAFFGEKLSTFSIIFHLFISSQENALLKKQEKTSSTTDISKKSLQAQMQIDSPAVKNYVS